MDCDSAAGRMGEWTMDDHACPDRAEGLDCAEGSGWASSGVVATALSRRSALILGVAGALLPQLAGASASEVEAELKKLYGTAAMTQGKIRLDVPEIAENGLVVPIAVEVESPMIAEDYVKAVHLFADGNPLPGIVTYRFTPECGRASAATRMRLAQTQNIICVAELSSGALYTARAEVKVTIGGCGG